VQHNMRIAAGRQKVVVKTEEACGFGNLVWWEKEEKGLRQRSRSTSKQTSRQTDRTLE
jgi:hypothetical protein